MPIRFAKKQGSKSNRINLKMVLPENQKHENMMISILISTRFEKIISFEYDNFWPPIR